MCDLLQSSHDVYYKFRFTFPFQDSETIKQEHRDLKKTQVTSITKTILDVLVPHYTTKLIYGIEFKNSRNEPTFIHAHLHFTSRSSRDTIAKALQRAMDKGNYLFKGSKVFSLKPEVHVTDKFWRYPLKQLRPECNNVKWCFDRCHGFTNDELSRMRDIAHEHYKTSVEINVTKSDNKDTQDTLFERLVSSCEKDKSENDTKKGLDFYRKKTLQFYVDEQRPLNFSTMSGYAYLLAYKFEAITEDDLVKRFA